jgi:hypothetical protein
MATILDLAKAKKLSKLTPGLRSGEQELRVLYASPRFEAWVVKTLPSLVSNWNLELTPEQQLDDYLNNYALGEPLTYRRQFNPIRYHKDGVWELKTGDVRVFGWFYRKDVFIAVVADETWKVKKHNLYAGYAGDVVRFRDALDIERPKFIGGKDPNNVISNFTTPP